MSYQDKKPPFLWIGLAIVVIAFLGFALFKNSNKEPAQYLTPVSSFKDAHGMAVDVADSSKVYIATHHGLIMMQNDKDLYHVGSGRDDYMGFSAHPTKPNTFFTSGHSVRGGNLGFQKSEDGGRTWQRVSNGVNGPVDFHSMTVSHVDPRIVYGTYRGKLQRSQDGGESWRVLDTSPINITSLATDTQDKNIVYTSTAQGLYVSNNQGDEWTVVSGLGAAVSAVAVNPSDNQNVLAYEQGRGLLQSSNGGKSWQPTAFVAAQSKPVMYLSYDKQQPSVVYALLQDLSIHKTTNSGQDWQKVR